MKIGFKHSRPSKVLVAAGLLAGMTLGSTALVWAADAALTNIPTSPAPAVAAPVAAAPAPAPAPVVTTPAPDTSAVLTTTPAPATPDATADAKGVDTIETKVPSSVKDAVKRLDTTNNITLDDLNSARQAIAKIEALIDIEKRLAELEKVRNEREGNTPTKTISPVAQSQLNPFPQQQAQYTPPPLPTLPTGQNEGGMPMPSFNPASNIEVSRIVGGAGHYSAMIKTPDGQSKTIQVGDNMDGNKVLAITSAGVEFEQGKSKQLVHVKNVDTVFGSTR